MNGRISSSIRVDVTKNTERQQVETNDYVHMFAWLNLNLHNIVTDKINQNIHDGGSNGHSASVQITRNPSAQLAVVSSKIAHCFPRALECTTPTAASKGAS